MLLTTKTRTVFLTNVIGETDLSFEVEYTDDSGFIEDLEVLSVVEVHLSTGEILRWKDGSLTPMVAGAWAACLAKMIEADAEFRGRVERKIEMSD